MTLTIKSKMALDDLVKARTINVDTAGSVVTLSGTIESTQERERAVRLARETERRIYLQANAPRMFA